MTKLSKKITAGIISAAIAAALLPCGAVAAQDNDGYTWDFTALYETTYLDTDGAQGWTGANASPYLSCTTDTITVAEEKLTETAADTIGIEYVSGKDGNAELKSTGLYSVYCGNLSFTYTAPDDGTVSIELATVTDGTAFTVSPLFGLRVIPNRRIIIRLIPTARTSTATRL